MCYVVLKNRDFFTKSNSFLGNVVNFSSSTLGFLALFVYLSLLKMSKKGPKIRQNTFYVKNLGGLQDLFFVLGGKEILERRLKVSDKQHPELQALRKHIAACFGKIDCYLMPHPGLRVATDPRFDGSLKHIEAGFKQHLKNFIPFILSPSKIEVKKISGNPVKCKELVGFFKAYIEIFKVNLNICINWKSISNFFQ